MGLLDRYRNRQREQAANEPEEHLPPEDRIESMVVIGLNAEDIKLSTGSSLFDEFLENHEDDFPGHDDEEHAFANWFWTLNTGLGAFLSGNPFGGGFRVFIGEKVASEVAMKSYFTEIDPGKLDTARASVTDTFDMLGYSGTPKINFLFQFCP